MWEEEDTYDQSAERNYWDEDEERPDESKEAKKDRGVETELFDLGHGYQAKRRSVVSSRYCQLTYSQISKRDGRREEGRNVFKLTSSSSFTRQRTGIQAKKPSAGG